MASSQSPNRIYFSSFDKNDTETNTDFSITFDTPIQGAYNYEIVQASFPNLWKSFAPYETIMYVRFPGGLVSGIHAGKLIGIPLSRSTVGVLGGGDPTQDPMSTTAARAVGIDGRYFLDGFELVTFLNNWFDSLTGATFPTDHSMIPFHCANINDYRDLPTRYNNLLTAAQCGTFLSDFVFTLDGVSPPSGSTNASQRIRLTNPAVFSIPSFREVGDLESESIVKSQLQYKLGFTSPATQSSSSAAPFSTPTVISITTVNLLRTSTVFFASSLASGESMSSGKRKDILFSVPLTSVVGQIQTYQSTISGVVINRPPSSIRTIRMTLLDENYEPMEQIPENGCVIVEVHFTYNEEAKEMIANRQTTNPFR